MTQSRILVVDDERIVSLDIQGALKRLGYDLAGYAATGAEALSLAASAKPDLVLMDIRLAGAMDGTEAAGLGSAETFTLLLRVSDTGCGIPESRMGMIFNSFTQGEDYLTRRAQGLGLGLAMCRRLAERLGGRIGVESREGEGSHFSFSVPLRRVPDLIESDQVQLQGVRVLVVEDDQVNRIFVVKTLERAGCAVSQAGSGEEALEALRAGPLDAVIMDLQLGGMDGLSVARLLRAGKVDGADPHTPVVALTAHARDGDRESCLLAGMDGVLTKPADTEELLALLRSVLSRRGFSGAQPTTSIAPEALQ